MVTRVTARSIRVSFQGLLCPGVGSSSWLVRLPDGLGQVWLRAGRWLAEKLLGSWAASAEPRARFL